MTPTTKSIHEPLKTTYIDSHTHSIKTNDPKVVETICHPSDDQTISFGIHPWHIDQTSQINIQNLSQKLTKFSIIGECGLDRSIKTNFSLQLSVFEAHLKHASQNHKLCVIHCVKSESDLLNLRKKYTNHWFLHGFLGNSLHLRQFLKLNPNTWFGFGYRLFDSKKVQKTLVDCPIEHILLETDSQNKYKIKDIYEKVCKLKQISIEHLIDKLQINHNKCFQIK